MQTQTNRPCLRPRRLVCIALVTVLNMSAALAQVAAGTTGIDSSGNYQKEVQACRSGQSQQDPETCLREARNTRADKNASQPEGTASDFKGNAESRCDALGGEDRAACQVRVLGYGSESGSVAGGGVLTSVETVVMPAPSR